MSKIRASWNYPTARTSGTELLPEAIQGAEIGLNSQVFSVAYPGRELLTPDLSFGTYSITGTVVLKNGKRSVPVSISVQIEDQSPPEVMLDLSAAIEP